MKKCFAIMLTAIMLLCVLPTTTAFASMIMAVDTDNIDLPIAGAKLDTSAQLGSLSNVMKITLVEWSEYDEGWKWQKDMTANDTFQEGYWYVVYVHLETNPGHNFGNSVAGTINNEAAKKSGNSVQANGTKVCFYTSYQATKLLTPIDRVDLTVVKPVIGKTPTFAKVDTTQYYSEKYGTVSNCSNGVTWTNQDSGVNITVSNPFKADTTYKVTYYLTAKEGYKFTRSTVCTINGVTATFEPVDHFHIKVSLGDLVPGDGKQEHTHTPSDWRTNQVYHYKACTTCGEFLEQDDHSGGVATCYEKGKCTVCDYAYIEENENHTHDTSKWTACGNLYHAHLCKLCGAHAIIEGHKSGPAATETAPQKCTVCDYILASAKNHQHNLTKVEKVDATCTEPGNVEYFTCNGCSDVFADSNAETQIPDTFIAPTGHKVSDDWKCDENNHWRVCSVCNAVLAETQMAHGMEDGKCTTCGYDSTQSENAPTNPSETKPDPTVPGQQDKGNCGMPWWGLLLIGLGSVGIGIGACILVLRKKKKE